MQNASFQDFSALTNFTISNKIVYDFSKSTSLKTSGRFFHQKERNIFSKDFMRKVKTNEWNMLFKIRHNLNEKLNIELDLHGSEYMTVSSFGEELNGEKNTNQLLTRPELKVDFKLNDKHTFTSGFGLNYERVKRTDFSQSPRGSH